MVRSSKIARSVTREKIKFEGELITNATFNGKILKIVHNTNNLLGIDWMTQFQLWNLPVLILSKNGKLEYRRWETKKIAYPEILTSWKRPASVQNEAKCALCFVGTN